MVHTLGRPLCNKHTIPDTINFSHNCPDLSSNETELNQLLVTSSFAPLPEALASTEMGYMDNLLGRAEEVDDSPVDFVAHVYVMPILLLLGRQKWYAMKPFDL